MSEGKKPEVEMFTFKMSELHPGGSDKETISVSREEAIKLLKAMGYHQEALHLGHPYRSVYKGKFLSRVKNLEVSYPNMSTYAMRGAAVGVGAAVAVGVWELIRFALSKYVALPGFIKYRASGTVLMSETSVNYSVSSTTLKVL